jgi:hypothetical protein
MDRQPGTQTLDLSPESIGRLPEDAQLVLASRCAMRVLPAFVPGRSMSSRERAAAIHSAQASCLIALDVAGTGRSQWAALGETVAKALESGAGQPPDPAALCIAAAARAIAVPTRAAFVQACIAAYLDAASRLGAYVPLGTAADNDRSQLLQLYLGITPPSRQVTLNFLGSPLFADAETPESWQPVVNEWARELTSLHLEGVYERYLGWGRGAEIDPDDVNRSIEGWGRMVRGPRTPVAQSSAPSRRPPDQWVLSDRPLVDEFTRRDFFGFKDYAEALAAILDHEKTETPFTMAINAPWGAGKTTLANMIVARLKVLAHDTGREPPIVCWFNAWMHDDAPNLATAFIAQVSRTANRHRRMIHRLFLPLPPVVLEPAGRRWRRVALVRAGLWWWGGGHLQHIDDQSEFEARMVTGYQMTTTLSTDGTVSQSETESRSRPTIPLPSPPPNPEDETDRFLVWVQSRLVVLGAFLTALAGLVGLLVKIVTSTSLAGFVSAPDKAAEAGAIQGAQAQVARLIRQATFRGNRFLVFVDDIERCKSSRSIDVLDAVNQLMDHDRVLVVLLGDMSVVAAAAQLKYKDLAEVLVPNAGVVQTGTARGKEAFGRLYLQKIVQFQFDLPIPSKTTIRDYMTRLAVGEEPEGGSSGGTAT